MATVQRSSEASAHDYKVLIAGCGYTGRALGQRLVNAGHAVWGLSRKPYDFPPGLEPLAADLTDLRSLAALPKAFDHVVYCASADTGSDEAYRSAYVEGCANLIRHLEPSTLKRFFFISSTAVYAQEEGHWVDESSPTTPAHYSGQRTLEAEGVVRASGLPSSVLRCSGIYGPGRDRLAVAVRRGDPMTVSERYTNRIHRDDIAGAVLHLIEHGTDEPVLLLSDDEPTTQKQIVELIASLLGVPVPPLTLDNQPAGSRGGNKRCNNRRLRATGYQLQYPTFREGYAELLGLQAPGSRLQAPT
jgi:nucleoside-diphosphate-sugar epimerase